MTIKVHITNILHNLDCNSDISLYDMTSDNHLKVNTEKSKLSEKVKENSFHGVSSTKPI